MTNYFIIDGMNLAFRAHTVNFELKTVSGLFSGMFYGFVRSLLSLKKKYRGYKFILAWDSRATKKFELYPEYKAGRAILAPAIAPQIEDIRTFLSNCGVEQYRVDGEEADDVIASLVEQLKSKAGVIIVYTNDKDLLQLVKTGKVVVYKPKVGHSDEKFYDEEAVVDQYGLPPAKLPLYRSFDGDASDNLPGVRRVPRKIIASVVKEAQSVGDFYERLSSVKLTENQKKAFEEARKQVDTNIRLMTLNKNLYTLASERCIIDKVEIEKVLSKYEIKSINPDTIVDLFTIEPNIRYSDARPVNRLESYSLF